MSKIPYKSEVHGKAPLTSSAAQKDAFEKPPEQNRSADSNSELLVFPKLRMYNAREVIIVMETKNVIFELRTKHGFSQDELAEKIHVTLSLIHI